MSEEIQVSQRMKEIHERRDEIRRKSEERGKQGLTPFPTVEEAHLLQQAEQKHELEEQRQRETEYRLREIRAAEELAELYGGDAIPGS